MTADRRTAATRPRGEGIYPWLLIGFFPIAWLGTTLAALSLGLMLPEMRRDLSLTDAQAGVIGGAVWGGSLILTLPVTAWLAHKRPVALQAMATLVAAVVIIAMALAPNFWSEALARVALAGVWAATIPVRTGITRQWLRPEQYGFANGLNHSIYGLVDLCAFWTTAPLLALVGGWRETLLLYAAFNAVIAILWRLFASDHPGTEPPPTDVAGMIPLSIGLVRRHKELLALAVVLLGANVTWSSMITFWPTFVLDQFGTSGTRAGMVMGLGAITVVPCGLLAATVARRAGVRMTLLVPCLAQVGLYSALLFWSNDWLNGLLWGLTGISWIYFPVIMTIPFHLRDIRAHEVAVASSLLITVVNLALAIGPPLAGGIGDATGSLRAGLLVTCAAPLISVAGALLLPRSATAIDGDAKAVDEAPPPGGPAEAPAG